MGASKCSMSAICCGNKSLYTLPDKLVYAYFFSINVLQNPENKG
jgi:hypothetical protein